MVTEWLGLAADHSLLLMGVVLFVILPAAKEVGYYAARRWHPHRGAEETVCR